MYWHTHKKAVQKPDNAENSEKYQKLDKTSLRKDDDGYTPFVLISSINMFCSIVFLKKKVKSFNFPILEFSKVSHSKPILPNFLFLFVSCLMDLHAIVQVKLVFWQQLIYKKPYRAFLIPPQFKTDLQLPVLILGQFFVYLAEGGFFLNSQSVSINMFWESDNLLDFTVAGRTLIE